MSASFNFTVNTQPMADEIKGVSHNVIGTTTAVVAMQAAVVEAEHKSARTICQNVNKGFFTLIHSQISQKIAKGQSDVDSYLLLMAAQTKQLTAIKDKMGHDYNIISARYTKLFNSLNQSLRVRIFEIDKAVVDFAVKEVGKISNRPLNLAALCTFMQLESLAASQQILSSYIKDRSERMLTFIHRFLTNSKRQREISENVMVKQRVETETSQIKIPAVICENIMDVQASKNISATIPQECLSGITKSEIKNAVFSQAADVIWKDEPVDEKIKSEFVRLNSESSSSQRVKNLAMELFNRSNFQTANGAVS